MNKKLLIFGGIVFGIIGIIIVIVMLFLFELFLGLKPTQEQLSFLWKIPIIIAITFAIGKTIPTEEEFIKIIFNTKN